MKEDTLTLTTTHLAARPSWIAAVLQTVGLIWVWGLLRNDY